MKSVISSFVIAFSMYSKIPMPRVEWTKENMKYVMCFFPVIGVVIGGLVFLWSFVDRILPVSQFFKTAGIVLIPVVITGGIHLDGLLDTADALSSYQPMEKKLEILKDSHSGAFAIITCVVYFMLSFAIWYEADRISLSVLPLGFVLSRAFSGLSIVAFPLAKDTGLANLFSNGARKRTTGIIMIGYILITAVCMLFIHTVLGIVCILSGSIIFLYYRLMSVKKFGGITGDLAGFFLQVCELAIAAGVVLGGKLCG